MRFLQRFVSSYNVPCFVLIAISDPWLCPMRLYLFLQYKVRIQGRGLLMSLWNVGSEDTEDPRPCYVVAERHLVKRTLERRERLCELPKGFSIEVTYEEPQRLPGVDQLRYLAPKTIHARDLRPGTVCCLCSFNRLLSLTRASCNNE